MNKADIIALMLLLPAILVACNSTRNTDLDLSNAELFIQQADGVTESVNDIEGVEEFVPFTIVYPKDLPEGVRLNRLQVSLPPTAMAEDARQREVRVLLQYADSEGLFSFQLTESIGEPTLVHPDLRTLEVNLTNGSIINLKTFEDAQTQFIGAVWAGCGIDFLLSGTMEEGLNADWPPRIAQSMLESCE